MANAKSARDFLPAHLTMTRLREAAKSCEGCELFERATQTVFGDGPSSASVMFVGEVPGDREDRAGKPFVGPAGQLLADALLEVGFDRSDVYPTNAVKHFYWEERGKRRLHKKPRWRHIHACQPWLTAEIAVVKPKMIVCLGATAAQSLLGADFRITRERGRLVQVEGLPPIVTTYHPAAILRAPEKKDAEQMLQDFKKDLKYVMQSLQQLTSKPAASGP